MEAQKNMKPTAYFKKFQSQNKKLRKKNLRYLKASLKGEKPKRVDKLRTVVLEQLKDSKKEIERLKPYKGDDILKKEYIRSLDLYINAFENNFGVADGLIKNRYNSYEDLKKYYVAVEKAEDEMLEAGYIIDAAEEYFAKKFKFSIVKDEELEEQFIALDEVTLYSRDMTLSYFRIDAQVRLYLNVVSRGNMDSLPDIVIDMRKAVRESKAEVETYSSFDGETDLYDEMLDYIEEIEGELEENLDPLTDGLQNEFMDQDEYEDIQDDLEDFVKRHNYRVNSFFETKTDLIESYFPEK
tara:strand:- start:235 stop:1125 length:891 start_codon:yes stop_codon:yes gene_type:complete